MGVKTITATCAAEAATSPFQQNVITPNYTLSQFPV